MKICIIQGSPNKNDLTVTCTEAAPDGIQQSSRKIVHVYLSDLKISFYQANDDD